MLKFFKIHWKLYIFGFLIFSSVAYGFEQGMVFFMANILNGNGVFLASLPPTSNQSQQISVSEISSDTPTTQNLQSDSLPADPPNFEDNSYKNTQLVVLDDKQDQIDDILEKIDILKRQIKDLKNAELAGVGPPQDFGEKVADNRNNQNNEIINPIQQQNNLLTTYAFSNSGSSSAFYSKILISEVQIGRLDDTKQEFVELYNPNNNEVDLTGWYVQRKTKTGSDYATFAPHALFLNKKIAPNGYFLIARQGYFGNLADIFIDNPLTEDNSLVLKNPNGDIADKVGWGQAQDFELLATQNPLPGQSIGRKDDPPTSSGQEADTDNNSADFEIETPTPKARNIAYVVPVPELPKDTTVPTVKFTLDAIQKNLDFSVDFAIKDPLETVTPSGIDGYLFRWQETGKDWQEDEYQKVDGAPGDFSAERNVTGEDEKSYLFQIKAKDAAGNESLWLPETPATTKISIFKKILINEVQTAGETTKDEFIELYNPNNMAMNLAGFSLKKKTSGGTESNLVSSGAFFGGIPALGYFLIAPQPNDDGTENYTGSVQPDLRYSGKTFSIASNNTILLYDKEDALLDKVGFGSAEDFKTAPAANPPASKSIQRKELGLDIDDNSNDFEILGQATPKNSVPVIMLPEPENPGLPIEPLVESAVDEPVVESLIDSIIEFPAEPAADVSIDQPPSEPVAEPVVELSVESVADVLISEIPVEP